jgi:hypothetical protein|tara:strand:+ start:660 stop:1268 length:609 start_codon:yes stop_codon:yes gene_type:complete
MSSQVDVYNLALDNIASKARVNSLTEDSVERKTCEAQFFAAREVVLEDHDWNFASFYDTLTLVKESTDTIPPPLPWLYQYTYPSLCVYAREITRQLDSEEDVPFRVDLNDDKTAKYIHTDKQDAILRYTRRITNITLFTPRAVEALGWKLATMIVISLNGNLKLKQNAEQSYLNAIASAKASNFNESVNRKAADPSLIQSRS